MSHTPGPWERHAMDIIASDERATIVCKVTGAESHLQAMADAALIAAAPDLLRALEAMLRAHWNETQDVAKRAAHSAAFEAIESARRRS